MKRGGPLKRAGWIKSSRKPMKKTRLKAEGATKRKRQQRYSDFIRSAKWKEIRKGALLRSGGQCENHVSLSIGVIVDGQALCDVRCEETYRLQVHHKTYARFGGKELPDDLVVLCKACHERLHAMEGKRLERRKSA